MVARMVRMCKNDKRAHVFDNPGALCYAWPMKQRQIPAQDIVRLRKNQTMPDIYDVEIEGIDHLKRYHSIECHIVLYPYSRKISSENISFYPFEEYVKDVLSQQRSAYALQQNRFNEVFGLLLGLAIALAFWI